MRRLSLAAAGFCPVAALSLLAGALLLLTAVGCLGIDAGAEGEINRDATMAAPAEPVDFNRLYRQSRRSVFYIDPTDGHHGAGWLLEPGLIVTVAHVVAGRDQVLVRQATAPSFPATVAARDSRRDVAFLRYDPAQTQLEPGAAPLPLGDVGSDDIATPLLALGYSTSGVKRDGTVGAPKANAGILSQITNFGAAGYGRNLEMDAAIDPGDSGGPALNPQGAVIGMVRSAARRSDAGGTIVGTFYAVHADEIRAALREAGLR